MAPLLLLLPAVLPTAEVLLLPLVVLEATAAVAAAAGDLDFLSSVEVPRAELVA